MRIDDVRTDVVCATRTGTAVRVIQLGPKAGGRLWQQTYRFQSGIAPSSETEQYRKSGLYSRLVGHLVLTLGRVSDPDDVRALLDVDVPAWTGDDATDEQLATDLKQRLRDNDTGIQVRVESTKQLVAADDFLADQQAKRDASAAKSRQREANEAAFTEVYARVAPMLAAAGVSETDRRCMVDNSRFREYGAEASIDVPVKVLADIADACDYTAIQEGNDE